MRPGFQARSKESKVEINLTNPYLPLGSLSVCWDQLSNIPVPMGYVFGNVLFKYAMHLELLETVLMYSKLTR